MQNEKIEKMIKLIFLFKVKDFINWKNNFDKDMTTILKAVEAKSIHIDRGLLDPNLVIIIVEFENLENVKNFSESEILKDRMQLTGFIDKPNILYAEEIENLTL